ncbi:NAD(P)H dehydrogenase [Hydrogenophaga sp. Root209]|uniref:NAD(P)H-dependent oxidoreductase n=1 Tax=unclassified Hydrogenophaga TaxID=2610897 RepID=UPI0006FBE706|nr:NAD(P)H-dependent oxidoreductase [Hydrogenophaga sp. Root209]KRC06294.1 NAD(P)H dehydrogenase [Hydrogenophaga sp. Root209]
MNALIVHAHPEPHSFNAALRDAAVDLLLEQGHAVEVSDLYAMNFKPVVDRDDFLTCRDEERFNVSLEQRHAHLHGGLAPDIRSELDRLQRADLLILQFPLWWFGMPAILKGWIDRVFVSGAVYGRSAMFEHGKLRGKRAMVCVTTGAPPQAFGPGSLNGDVLDLLAPLHRGVLAFTGMSVLPPYVAYHVPYAGAEGRAGMLHGYREHLLGLETLAPLTMPRMADHPMPHEDGARPRAQ